MIRSIAAAAIVIGASAMAYAAGPFEVRRATSGQDVQSSPPLATIVTSPFDGDLASMQDGTSYYYGVYDASGQPQQISVIKNTATGTLRISFDDASAASAPVSAASSSVAVAPATIQADGLQAATITIVPRDADGVLLGLGLTVSIDASMLWPAQLTAPIADAGDGSYLATAVAPVTGIGTVRVTAEGVQLAPLPTITALAADPAASLRDLAIAQLASLLGPGGPLASLQAQAGANSPQADDIADAIDRANDALQSLANNPTWLDGVILRNDFDAILSLLEDVLESPGALDALAVRDVMDDLVGVARMIAQWHVDQAAAECGACNGAGNPYWVCEAVDEMASADAMRAELDPDWGDVVDTYGAAIQRALLGVYTC